MRCVDDQQRNRSSGWPARRIARSTPMHVAGIKPGTLNSAYVLKIVACVITLQRDRHRIGQLSKSPDGASGPILRSLPCCFPMRRSIVAWTSKRAFLRKEEQTHRPTQGIFRQSRQSNFWALRCSMKEALSITECPAEVQERLYPVTGKVTCAQTQQIPLSPRWWSVDPDSPCWLTSRHALGKVLATFA